MAKRDILKEAIADAKAVKETAIANAKAALEEAFTPQLKSMLAAKLEEMDLEEEKETVEEMTAKEKAEGDDRKDDKIEKETEKMREAKGDDEEINLDEILAELEGELTKEENIEEDARTDAEEEGYEDGMEDEKEDIEGEEDDSEEEEIDLEDMTDDDLKVFIEDVIADMVGSGELEAGENFEEEDVEVEDEVDVDVESEEEIEISEEKEVINEDPSVAEVYKEMERYKKALQEVRSEIKYLKASNKVKDKALNEVNLLNAKLLYTNKIFKSKTLTESQKVKVLGAFDKAGTVKETKLVYETLNEGLKVKKSPIRESLGAASKVTGNFRKTKNPIIATDPMVARFQKLAGLK